MNKIRAWWYRLLSYRKKARTLEDYPIRTHKHDFGSMEKLGRLTLVPWSAQIINWLDMEGFGNTKEEAFANMRENFERYRETRVLSFRIQSAIGKILFVRQFLREIILKTDKPMDHPFLQALQGQFESVRVAKAYRVAVVTLSIFLSTLSFEHFDGF